MIRSPVTLAIPALLTLLLAAGCGGGGFPEATVTCKVAGYYVDFETPEAERALLRVGVLGRASTGGYVEVGSGTPAYDDERSIILASILLPAAFPEEIVLSGGDVDVDFARLDIVPYLDSDGSLDYTPGEAIVGDSQERLYYLDEDYRPQSGKRGYNYLSSGVYAQDFEQREFTVTTREQ